MTAGELYLILLHSISIIFYSTFFSISLLINQLLERLHEKWSSVKKQSYPAMYSSVYGGIVLDPAMMVIPIDDHMVHRGHGVFDTSIIFYGYA